MDFHHVHMIPGPAGAVPIYSVATAPSSSQFRTEVDLRSPNADRYQGVSFTFLTVRAAKAKDRRSLNL